MDDDEDSPVAQFTRVCIKDYIHQQMKNSLSNSVVKPQAQDLPAFDQDAYMDIMKKNIREQDKKRK